MKITETKYGVNRAFTFDGLKGSFAKSVSIAHDDSNCKLSYIHQLGCINGLKKEEKIDIVNHLLIHTKGCVIINTIVSDVYNFIKENYKVYYAHEVPIGYYDKFQYHVCIKNDVYPNAYCKDPVPEKLAKGAIDKTAIKKQLKTLLKAKRRKDDYVDEFIESL